MELCWPLPGSVKFSWYGLAYSIESQLGTPLLKDALRLQLDGVRGEADPDMSFYPVAQAVVDGADPQVCLIHAERPLDEPQVVAIRDKLFRRIVTPR